MFKPQGHSSKYSPAKGVSPRYTDEAPPLPFPNGWFCAGFSDELLPGKVTTRRLAGQDLVLYRTRSGLIRATRPYCPHLGAHLGTAGRIEGEEVVCSFHGFAFGPDGTCTRTGYGTRPPKAFLPLLPVREEGGLILVWHHHAGAAPTWDLLPAHPGEFTPVARDTTECAGHPQEVLENIVDFGHLTALHWPRVSSVRVTKSFTEEGTTSRVVLEMAVRPPGWKKPMLTSYEFTLHGLGGTEVHIHLPAGFTVRIWFMPTPVAPWRIQLRSGIDARVPAPGFLPTPANRALAAAGSYLLSQFFLWYHNRVFLFSEQNGDVPVWNTKEYLARPRLTEGDGPITRYRRWAGQFYP
ncbi:Rieske 2Fe-2S domain-containing protein [Streptomyces gilvosporeus]|uniref:Rieske 2Fe-2S domain-containing protein n=1 Tax=Streptomyces gilvosporeus TaxID=553510 RepID=UPI00131EBA38|nr:Rieske 2Fe-2S domain-containing protein [Streptomyces gilvosporeus]